MNRFFQILWVFLFSLFGRLSAVNGQGTVNGTLQLDDSWQRKVHLSFIETIEREYAVSKEMILASAEIDSMGRFSIPLDHLSKEWSLLRLHVVKKGSPAASLVIGGADENHFFFVANQLSEIEIRNTFGKPVFDQVMISGEPYLQTFELIKKLVGYSNSLEYENSLIENEFLEEVVHEKLKRIADTCSNSLVSLYAIYQTDFVSRLKEFPSFYDDYLAKWEEENSSYWKSFRRQLPAQESSNYSYYFLLLLLLPLVYWGMIRFQRSNSKIKQLTVQERKIFESIRKGASNQEISDEFHIEQSTVKSHISSIYAKLKIKSRREAINIRIK